MAKDTPLACEINLRAGGLVFDVRSLFEASCGLVDQRDGRGLRPALTTILTYTVTGLDGNSHLGYRLRFSPLGSPSLKETRLWISTWQ